jgi:hypothetical protein
MIAAQPEVDPRLDGGAGGDGAKVPLRKLSRNLWCMEWQGITNHLGHEEPNARAESFGQAGRGSQGVQSSLRRGVKNHDFERSAGRFACWNSPRLRWRHSRCPLRRCHFLILQYEGTRQGVRKA